MNVPSLSLTDISSVNVLVAILQSNLDGIIDFLGTIVATKCTITDQRDIITTVELSNPSYCVSQKEQSKDLPD